MNKLKFIVAASIAAALTFSCASDEEEDIDDNGSSNNSSSGSNSGAAKTYELVEVDVDEDGDAYFVYSIPDYFESCEEGVYTTESRDQTKYYSIDNKKMTWGLSAEYSIQFNGSSNELVGTWTRTKSKCNLDVINDVWSDIEYMSCKPDYDVTKVVFTETTVAITRNQCPTDYVVDGSKPVEAAEGWKIKVKDCNTIEKISKDSDKITEILNNDGSKKITYKNKSCQLERSKAKMQAACKKAWDTYQDGDYEWILSHDYRDCQEGILPEDYFDWGDEGGDEGDGYCADEEGIFDFCNCYDECLCADYGDVYYTNWCVEGALGKPALKAKAKTFKLKPLLKKKK